MRKREKERSSPDLSSNRTPSGMYDRTMNWDMHIQQRTQKRARHTRGHHVKLIQSVGYAV